jgi:hypothetical protein
MSWMTKEGSSSASGPSPQHFPPSELARCQVAPTRHDATETGWVGVVDDWRSSGPEQGRAYLPVGQGR